MKNATDKLQEAIFKN